MLTLTLSPSTQIPVAFSLPGKPQTVILEGPSGEGCEVEAWIDPRGQKLKVRVSSFGLLKQHIADWAA